MLYDCEILISDKLNQNLKRIMLSMQVFQNNIFSDFSCTCIISNVQQIHDSFVLQIWVLHAKNVQPSSIKCHCFVISLHHSKVVHKSFKSASLTYLTF